MKAALFAGLVAGAAARTDVFGSWMSKHGKSYSSKEEMIMRREFP